MQDCSQVSPSADGTIPLSQETQFKSLVELLNEQLLQLGIRLLHSDREGGGHCPLTSYLSPRQSVHLKDPVSSEQALQPVIELQSSSAMQVPSDFT